MSHFYGTLQGSRGEATRCGTPSSGMETYCASWSGAIKCFAFKKEIGKDEKGKPIFQDWVRVEKVKWQGQGDNKVLYEGPIGIIQEVN